MPVFTDPLLSMRARLWSWPGAPPSTVVEPGSWLRCEHVPFAPCCFSLREQQLVAVGSGNGSRPRAFPGLFHQRGMRGPFQVQGNTRLKRVTTDNERGQALAVVCVLRAITGAKFERMSQAVGWGVDWSGGCGEPQENAQCCGPVVSALLGYVLP